MVIGCCAAAPPLRAKDLLKASMAGYYWRSAAVGINLRECSRVTAANPVWRFSIIVARSRKPGKEATMYQCLCQGRSVGHDRQFLSLS